MTRSFVLTAEKPGGFVKNIARSGIESNRNDSIKTEKHSTLEVVGLPILDGVSNNQDRHCEGNSLD